MKEIRAAVFRDTSLKPSIETLRMSEPGADEVLVKLTATGVCHTDMHTAVTEGRSPRPVVLGHEGAGVVEAVGSDVADLEPGDHVVMTFTWCGHCPSCRTARPAYCYNVDPFACARSEGGGTTCMAMTDRCMATSSINRRLPPMPWGTGGVWSRCARMRP